MKRMFGSLAFLGILALFVVSGCNGGGGNSGSDYATPVGSPIASAVTKTIDGTGGTLTSADGIISMTVPTGAVSAPTQFSIQPIENNAHGGVGNGYRLGPEGVVLAQPVTLTFQVPNDGSSGAILGIAYQDAQGNWQWVNDATRDADPPNTKTVSVTTDHFSDWSLVRGVAIMPMTTSVQTKGIVQLSVVYCVPPTLGKEAVSVMNDCSGPPPLVATANWSVNGTPGGNATYGTVKGTNLAATFTAPAQKPNPAQVGVSVQVPPLKSGSPNVWLFSSITITDVTEWHIQFVYKENVYNFNKTMTFDLRFKADVSTGASNIPFAADSSSFVTYSGSGTDFVDTCSVTLGGSGTITKLVQLSANALPGCASGTCTSADDYFDAEGYVDAKNKRLVIYLKGEGYGLTHTYCDGGTGTDSAEYETGILESGKGYQVESLPSVSLGVLPAVVIPMDNNFAIQGGSPSGSGSGVTMSLTWSTTSPVSPL